MNRVCQNGLKKSKNLATCCIQETHLRSKNTQTEKEVFHGNGNGKLQGSNTYANKIGFKTKTVTRDKEEHYLKGSF